MSVNQTENNQNDVSFEDAMKVVIEAINKDDLLIKDEKGRGWVTKSFLDAQCYWVNKQINYISTRQLPDNVARLRAERAKRSTDDEYVVRYTNWIMDTETRLNQYKQMQSVFERMYEHETGDKYRPKTSRDVLDTQMTAANAEADALLERFKGMSETFTQFSLSHLPRR